jgi:hypothetical protein
VGGVGEVDGLTVVIGDPAYRLHASW